MTVFICADNKMGVLFQGKRQSKDRILRKRILDIVEQNKSKLVITKYSYEQFKADRRDELLDVRNELDFSETNSFVFIEDEKSFNSLPWEKIDELVLCCWERDYPADIYLHKSENVTCILNKKETLSGSSHEMTLEFYDIK